jgi:hypothetical protein
VNLDSQIRFIIVNNDKNCFGDQKVLLENSTKFHRKLKVFSDRDGAGNPETRISVTDFIVYLQGIPVCWRSKAQRGVTLSSTKAEYVEMSDALKEIRFIYFFLNDIGIEVELPTVVRTDNVVA